MKLFVKYKFFGLKRAIATNESGEIVYYTKSRLAYGHFATKVIYGGNGKKLYTLKINNYTAQRKTIILDADKKELGVFSIAVMSMTPEFSFVGNNGDDIKMVLNSAKNGLNVVKGGSVIGHLMPAQKGGLSGKFEIDGAQKDLPLLFALGIASDVFRRETEHL